MEREEEEGEGAHRTGVVEIASTGVVWARSRWSRFRAESPYFQAKVFLVAGYVAICLLTLFLAPPPAQRWEIRAEQLSFGLSFKTTILVTNLANGDLEDVVVEVRGKGVEFDGKEVPGVWKTRPLRLLEGDKVRIVTEQLFDSAGRPPPYQLVAERVRVLEDGREIASVVP